MKKFLAFMLAFLGIFENLKAMDSEMFDLVNLYQQKGIVAVAQKLDKYFLSADYWLKALGDKDVSLGYYESVKFVFLSNKDKPDLQLFEITNSTPKQLGESSALVAKGKGHKNAEGDLTTPIGVYALTDRLTGLPPYYGPLAFPMDYPNAYDRSFKKTGSGIWIHGLPLDGNREELNTRGCIAIDNDLLKKYDKLIDFRKSIVIVTQGEFRSASREQIAQILSGVYSWREFWKNGDFKNYISFYDDSFIRADGMKYRAFVDYKKAVFAKNESKQIEISDINIAPFVDENGREMFKVSFMQNYKAFLNGRVNFATNSKKELFAVLTNGELKIVSEK